MTRQTWLIPLAPSPDALKSTLRVFEISAISYTIVSAEDLRERLDLATPSAAVVHGGGLTPLLIEVQGWLARTRVPTLVLVEGLTEHHEASLLDRGARDVVAIPTSARRLRSRLESVVRHHHETPAEPHTPKMVSVSEKVKIHPRQRTVEVDQQPVALTKSEFDLLLVLALNQGDVVSRLELATAAGKAGLSDRALESHISRIRNKFREAGVPDHIESVRSVGYRLRTAT